MCCAHIERCAHVPAGSAVDEVEPTEARDEVLYSPSKPGNLFSFVANTRTPSLPPNALRHVHGFNTIERDQMVASKFNRKGWLNNTCIQIACTIRCADMIRCADSMRCADRNVVQIVCGLQLVTFIHYDNKFHSKLITTQKTLEQTLPPVRMPGEVVLGV